MKKLHLFVVILLLITLALVFKLFQDRRTNIQNLVSPTNPQKTWQIKSIDTMKYSRDVAAQALNDPSFDSTIDMQVRLIKEQGANYVAIATPYDEKFVPVLARWVAAARRYNLHVWFRGNFSGWEGWFGQSRDLSRQEHLEMTRDFIQNHKDLFRHGDIFSPCPECENGGSGDPRSNGDIGGFRKFMVDENKAAAEEFKKIGKNVATNFASMNYDVATLVMDHETTLEMGNLIVIDHYIKTPDKLSADINSLSTKTGAQIFLGEFGAPIADITGPLDEQQQAAWIDNALKLMTQKEVVIGINYWVATGGSTAIFHEDGSKKPAAEVVKKYFSLTKYN